MTATEQTSIETRIDAVRERIASSCQRSGRDPNSVTLIAVSKTVDRDAVDRAYRAGIRDFGENRIAEAGAKFAVPLPDDTRLHMIGQLQSNKAGPAIELFDLIHSVDRISLIRELDRHAARKSRLVDVLLQVNTAQESQKAGCDPEAARSLAAEILKASGLRLRGLMTMAPLVDDPERVRPVFRALAALRESLLDLPSIGSLPVLSMGMTNDFEVAVEEGATHIRVGRALFGE